MDNPDQMVDLVHYYVPGQTQPTRFLVHSVENNNSKVGANPIENKNSNVGANPTPQTQSSWSLIFKTIGVFVGCALAIMLVVTFIIVSLMNNSIKNESLKAASSSGYKNQTGFRLNLRNYAFALITYGLMFLSMNVESILQNAFKTEFYKVPKSEFYRVPNSEMAPFRADDVDRRTVYPSDQQFFTHYKFLQDGRFKNNPIHAAIDYYYRDSDIISNLFYVKGYRAKETIAYWHEHTVGLIIHLLVFIVLNMFVFGGLVLVLVTAFVLFLQLVVKPIRYLVYGYEKSQFYNNATYLQGGAYRNVLWFKQYLYNAVLPVFVLLLYLCESYDPLSVYFYETYHYICRLVSGMVEGYWGEDSTWSMTFCLLLEILRIGLNNFIMATLLVYGQYKVTRTVNQVYDAIPAKKKKEFNTTEVVLKTKKGRLCLTNLQGVPVVFSREDLVRMNNFWPALSPFYNKAQKQAYSEASTLLNLNYTLGTQGVWTWIFAVIFGPARVIFELVWFIMTFLFAYAGIICLILWQVFYFVMIVTVRLRALTPP